MRNLPRVKAMIEEAYDRLYSNQSLDEHFAEFEEDTFCPFDSATWQSLGEFRYPVESDGTRKVVNFVLPPAPGLTKASLKAHAKRFRFARKSLRHLFGAPTPGSQGGPESYAGGSQSGAASCRSAPSRRACCPRGGRRAPAQHSDETKTIALHARNGCAFMHSSCVKYISC